MDLEFVQVCIDKRIEELRNRSRKNEASERSENARTVVRCQLNRQIKLLILIRELVEKREINQLSDDALNALCWIIEARCKEERRV